MNGEVYTGFSLNQVGPSKTLKQVQNVVRGVKTIGTACNKVFCAKAKSRFCNSFPENARAKIFNQFRKNLTWDQKKSYVCSLVNIIPAKRPTTKNSSKRTETFVYFLKLDGKKMQVCRAFFCKT